MSNFATSVIREVGQIDLPVTLIIQVGNERGVAMQMQSLDANANKLLDDAAHALLYAAAESAAFSGRAD